MPRCAIASAMTACVRRQISSGSCSTQPGCGIDLLVLLLGRDTMRMCRSNTMKRVLVVPWSIAPM